MSIKDFSTQTFSPTRSPSVGSVPRRQFQPSPVLPHNKPQIKRQLRLPAYSSLLFFLLIALIIRVWLVIHTQGFIDGDEALVGIQAEHILRGEIPFYFYNQPYMGSLEAYLVAIIFAIAGPSAWALRAEPVLLSLVVVYLTWKLAGVLSEVAQLSSDARQWFMNISALLAALSPLYDTVVELRTLGGYIEIFILMLLLLIAVLQLTRRRQKGASTGELALRWAGIGFIVGLGFWVDPLIISTIIAAAIWIFWDWMQSLREVRRTKHMQPVFSAVGPSLAGMQSRKASSYRLLPALASIPASLIGATPAIIWGASNSWANFTYLLQLGGNTTLRVEITTQYPTRQALISGVEQLYTNCIAPRVISGALPGEAPPLLLLHTLTLVLGIFCILATTTSILLSFVVRHPSLLLVRRLAALPLLFGVCSALTFISSTASATGLYGFCSDLSGRYATPLMLVLPFFYATMFAVIVMAELYIHEKHRRYLQNGSKTSLFSPHWIVYASSAASREAQAARRHGPSMALHLQRVALGILLGLLLLALYAQVSTYGLTDPGGTFQSPYCNFAPANNDPIIAYLEQEHIHYAWAINWIADPIVFKTDSRIIVADPLPQIRDLPMLNRIPAYTDAVMHANRPSMIVFVNSGDTHPRLLRLFDKEHITYRFARFPSVPGVDVMVVTPISRTVSPFGPGGNYFGIFFCTRDGW